MHNLRTTLIDFHTTATRVWTAYQDLGPGRVDPALFGGGQKLSAEIASLLTNEAAVLPAEIDGDELHTAVLKVTDLATRCATHSEGLCFITGEAGLVPRRDWHTAMEEGLAAIEQAIALLGKT